MPLVRPVMSQVRAEVDRQNAPSGVAVAVYPVISDPPVLVGADHVTVIWPAPAVPAALVGAPGVVDGVAAAPAEALLLPAEFAAVTVTS